MRVWIGRSILVVALIHSVFGLVFLGGALTQLFRGGVFGSVTLMTPSSGATSFWFFVAGALGFMLGGLVDHVERLGIAFPTFLAWSLLALTVVGCVLMPVSAWWLLLVPSAGMFARGRSMGSGDVHAG
jgi:CHASE2 domain-containing sensor protein